MILPSTTCQTDTASSILCDYAGKSLRNDISSFSSSSSPTFLFQNPTRIFYPSLSPSFHLWLQHMCPVPTPTNIKPSYRNGSRTRSIADGFSSASNYSQPNLLASSLQSVHINVSPPRVPTLQVRHEILDIGSLLGSSLMIYQTKPSCIEAR